MKRSLTLVAMLLGSTSIGMAQEGQDGFLGTIVLGERTERALSETYVGASVLDGDDLKETTVGEHINETLTATPNLFVEGKSEVPSLRGIQGGGPGGTVSAGLTGALPRLSFVIDGVTRPVVLPNSSGSSLWDVQQIEVLRGPQSLLRGRSAYAGAIIVTTNIPTFEPEAALQFGFEHDDFHGINAVANGMVSGTLSENIAGRLTFEFANGSDPRRATDVRDHWIVDYDNIRVRGKLLGEFETGAGGLTLNLLAEHQSGQTPQTRNTVQTSTLTGRPLDQRLLVNAASGPLGIPARTFDTYTNVLSFDAALDMGHGTLRSITSYVDDGYKSIPEQVYPFPFDVTETTYTQEFLYEFGPDERVKSGELSGLLGFSYEHREQQTDISGLFQFVSDIETKSTAGFVDLRYGITDQLTVFGGLRAQKFEDSRRQTSTFGPTTGTQIFDDTERILLPALGLAYYFDENKVLSGSVRTGFNPGGSSVNIFTGQPFTYDSESVVTTEVTYRQEAADGRYEFGITGFYNEFDDPQLYAELVPGNRASLQVINQEEGRSYGLELDGSIQATDRLRLSGSLGLLETEITKPQTGNPGLNGNSFGQDPSLTLSIGADYAFNSVWSMDTRATYRGESYNDFNNIAADKVGDYWIVDVGVTARKGNTEFRGYVKNLFDETGVTRFVAGRTFADVTDPMTIGLTMTTRW
ncbi:MULTISPECIES: TonB-dependent receptor [unclassified Roseovarius]|uniref:TonB-dependent receptor n=1 Tax=unclassified Roseovarius TaxID=2614913 RepID=UPI00273F5F5F|nr:MULTISPECIES: TonB-dependent receptor [unclassified Roseovarius]